MIDQRAAQRWPPVGQDVDGLHDQPVRQVIQCGDPVADLIGDIDLPLVQLLGPLGSSQFSKL